MESIKELEAEGFMPRQMIECNKHFDSAIRYIQVNTLKDVLKLIDEDKWLSKFSKNRLKSKINGK